jgi:hypothetical protein
MRRCVPALLMALLACVGCATGSRPSSDDAGSMRGVVPEKYVAGVTDALRRAGGNAGELRTALVNAPPEERDATAFLIAYMPLSDLASASAEFINETVGLACRTRREVPWGASVPDDVFLNYVLPHRIAQEPISRWRPYFYSRLRERVAKCATMSDAVLEVNKWCGENLKFKQTEFRDQTALDSLKSGYGRCEEMTIMFISAARAVCIPARAVATPWWATCDNNHAWPEAWADGHWHFLGGAEPAPTLDDAWFKSPARRAMIVVGTCYGIPENDPDAIAAGKCAIVNATSTYSETCALHVRVTDPSGNPVEGAGVFLSVCNYGAFRPITRRVTDKDGRAEFPKLGSGDILLTAGRDKLRAWTIVRTVARGSVEASLELRTDQAPPDGFIWLRYPKPK